MQKSATFKIFKKMLAKIKKKVYYITNTTIKDFSKCFWIMRNQLSIFRMCAIILTYIFIKGVLI